MSFKNFKANALLAFDHSLHWTHKKSLQLPRFTEFIYAIVTRQRGGIKYDEKRKVVRQLNYSDLFVILGIAIAYLSSVFGRVSLSVLAPELQVDKDLSYDTAKHGQLIVAMQVCFVVGKLANGFIIDMANPRYMIFIYLIGSSIANFAMASVHTAMPEQSLRFNYILGWSAVNALCQSGIWTASTKFIHDHYRPAQVGKAIVILSICAKMGSVCALLILSAVVTTGRLFWFDAQRFAAGVTLFGTIPLLSTFFFAHPAPHLAAASLEQHHAKKYDFDAPAPSREQVHAHGLRCSREALVYNLTFMKHALLRWLGWWSKRQFVLVALANGSMAVVCSVEGLEAFLTLYFFNGLKVASLVASQSAMVLPLGVAVSLFSGFWIERLDRPSKADVVIFMLLATVLVSIILLIVTITAEEALAAGLVDPTSYLAGAIIPIFFIGVTMGYAFFVPISTFALAFGGDHAALASATLSVFASCVGAAFSAAVGILASTSWVGVMGLVVAFSVSAFCSMTLFYYFELVDKRQMIAEAKQKGVLENLQELVVHRPHYEMHAAGPAGDSSFVHQVDPTVNEALDSEKPAVMMMSSDAATASVEDESLSSKSSEPLSKRWVHAVEKFGPGLRLDANKKVKKEIMCFFFVLFVSLCVGLFVSYFAARTDPNFVFPFGDGVRFANKTS